MKKTYEFRLYPNRQQERALLRTLDSCRRLYNAMLWQRQMAYDRRVRLTRFDQEKQLSELRAGDPEFGAVYAHLLQDAARRLDLAFKAFFRRCKAGGTPGYPRFKGRDHYTSITFKEAANGCVRLDADRGRVSLSKIGEGIRVFLHRPILGAVKTATVKRRASGWYILLSCDDVPPDPALKKGASAVGIDVGLTHFATLSTGETIPNPRPLQRGLRALTACQRRVSRKVKGSRRRRAEVRVLRRHHERIHNRRKDFAFKSARSLVERFDEMAVEDLPIQELVQNGGGPNGLRRGILDASWGMFLSALEHKAEEAGALVVRVEPRGTTRLCSGCGASVPKALGVRTHECPACGLVLGRDHNAALNILGRARTAPAWRAANG